MTKALYVIDEFDNKLLELLKENSKLKNTELAKSLNVTEGAIRNRISKLVSSGIIEKFTIQIKEEGSKGWAVIEIIIEGNIGSNKIKNQIEELIPKGIETIYETAGDVDLLIIFNSNNTEDLKNAIEKLRSISGVRDTNTRIVLTRTKY
ncbi:MAG: Lrp/AsnC family transcriptional regulator [Candidatus Heimdallarchaeota archaeon]|nr:Lrp/AsnC family transcriptional regulator [Candidatus Heimdallarchaeota archaeon]MDH5647092.1 Lrp/AsnC family transcriptional regulator [Candidatus Heimdallarchaeota archaeon]